MQMLHEERGRLCKSLWGLRGSLGCNGKNSSGLNKNSSVTTRLWSELHFLQSILSGRNMIRGSLRSVHSALSDSDMVKVGFFAS